MNEVIQKYGINEVEWNIQNKDFLKEKIEHKFDYIIGNPPYITYHDMKEDQKELLKKNYKTCKKGRSDYCYAFIEASINALAVKGKMIYLVPYSIMTNKFAEELRKFIRPYMTQIYDYRTIKIFPDATTSSVILVCENEKDRGTILYHLVAKEKILEIPKERLGKKWIILGNQNISGKRFGEYFEVNIIY